MHARTDSKAASERHATDSGTASVEIQYDSEYAANLAQGKTTPKINGALARQVQALVTEVSQTRALTWTHVYGHQGHNGNEWADRLAAKGADGQAAPQSRRWTEPPTRIPDQSVPLVRPREALQHWIPRGPM